LLKWYEISPLKCFLFVFLSCKVLFLLHFLASDFQHFLWIQPITFTLMRILDFYPVETVWSISSTAHHFYPEHSLIYPVGCPFTLIWTSF
jgi:hypothetical protein